MECQTSQSKKMFKVFEATKRKQCRRKGDGQGSKSTASDDSTSVCQANGYRAASAKASLQNTSSEINDVSHDVDTKRDRENSPSRSPEGRRTSRSPRRHYRRPNRDGISLALKAGLVPTPRSLSPRQTADVVEKMPKDQDSFIYAYLEEAIKRDKKKQRHVRKLEEQRESRDRDGSDHRHHQRRNRENSTRENDKLQKVETPASGMDTTALFETFAKLCATFNDKTHCSKTNNVQRTQSHKSLQCEGVTPRDSYEVDHRPVKLRSHENSRENIPTMRLQSPNKFRGRIHSNDNVAVSKTRMDEIVTENCACCASYKKDNTNYISKVDISRSRIRNMEEDRYRDYTPRPAPTVSCLDHGYRFRNTGALRDYRDYDDCRELARGRHYVDDKRRYIDQKTSRSFDVHREDFIINDRGSRRTARSDVPKEKRYDERRFDDRDRVRSYVDNDHREKYYDHKNLPTRAGPLDTLPIRDHRTRKNLERFERCSVVSRDDDYKEKDQFSDRERDSGLSVAETSSISGRSNYLRVVKQEMTEQREAMDKMMKLWKELMRCFKGMSHSQGPELAVHETAAKNARDSAAEQLRLWRECMRRYETVARDVGDTDARLMEEINKQRSEMTEMAGMWQECLQRYRDISNDFNNLKQKLAAPESPVRKPAPPVVCAEGEGSIPPAAYRMPPTYPPMPPMGPYPGGSPLRERASAPPAWWWCDQSKELSRRRSSPDSRGSRDRDRKHRHKERERDDTRYKEKSKPSGARSEHRHRKR